MSSASFQVPENVIRYVAAVFSEVNNSVSRKISITPNSPEENLDIAFIDKLSEFAGPTKIDTGWAVQIATHFIGNIRHYRRYEIADIGVVIVFKKSLKIVGRKLILLQSKRLYPLNNEVEELEDFDYELGLGKLIRDSPNEASIFSKVLYKFSNDSIYGAMRKNSEQCRAIANHFNETDIPVHYMFYNPLILPWKISYPLTNRSAPLPERTFGTRICNSLSVHQVLAAKSNQVPPSVSDFLIGMQSENHAFGLSLEDFFESVIRCREGFRFESGREPGIRRLFNRKSGPIFCIVEIAVEEK